VLKEQMNKVLQLAESNYKSYDNLVEEVYQKAKGRLGDKDQEINELKAEMKKISETFKSYEDHVARWGKEWEQGP
jgi:peptidoglycan hydrolase CwlO-like protein